jgi:hypothetical protein
MTTRTKQIARITHGLEALGINFGKPCRSSTAATNLFPQIAVDAEYEPLGQLTLAQEMRQPVETSVVAQLVRSTSSHSPTVLSAATMFIALSGADDLSPVQIADRAADLAVKSGNQDALDIIGEGMADVLAGRGSALL